MTAEFDSPSGLDMHPSPPPAVRVRKAVGAAFLALVGLFVMAIVYGIFERQRRQTQALSVADTERKATAAINASREFTSNIPDGGPLNKETPVLSDTVKIGVGDDLSQQKRVGIQPLGRRGIPEGSLVPPSPNGMERAEDIARQAAYQKEQEAIEAPTRIGGGNRSYTGNTNLASAGSSPLPTNSTPATFNGSGSGVDISRLSGGEPRTGLAGMSQAAEYSAQNAQEDKAGFVAQARRRAPQNYLQSARTAPLSRFEIKAGWEIPATLEQEINSDQPGEIKALVRENVYDTATGKYLLLPQGARLIGSYNSVVSYGQDGVQAVWDRVILPDGSSLNLNGMIGQDAQGESGLRHSVDHHYTRLIGFAMMTSLFSAGFQLSQNRSGSILAVPSPGEVVAGAVGSQLSQLGMEITRRNLNVQPTIKVPIGYRFNVRVNRDIAFDAPYSRLP